MSHRRSVVFMLVVMLVLGTFLVSCGPAQEEQGEAPTGQQQSSEPAAPPPAEKVLVVGTSYDAVNLDPANLGPSEFDMAFKIYNGLIRLKTGTSDVLVGDLAESWEISDEGTEYTFHLRKGVQWQKGYGEFTAKDVEFSYERLKDEALASKHLSEAQMIEDVEVVDDYTVKIKLASVWPDFAVQFLAGRPGFIVNEKALNDFGDRYFENAVGTGPYILDKFSQRDEVVFKRNPDYFGDQPYFDTIRYAIILDENVLAVALENGEVDIAYVTDPVVQLAVMDSANLNVEKRSSDRTYFANLNNKREPTNDKRVRQALWWAIDKDQIVEVGFQGLAVATDTLLNVYVPEYLAERPYHQDQEKAQQLLDEAGFDMNTVLEMPTYKGDVMTPVMQAQYAEMGLTVDTPLMEDNQHVDTLKQGKYHIGVRRKRRLTADAYWSEVLMGDNSAGFQSDAFDSLVIQARGEIDDQKRKDINYEIQRMIFDEAPLIPLANPVLVLAMQKDIVDAPAGLIRIPEDTIRREE